MFNKTCCVVTHKQYHFQDGRYVSAGGFNRYVEVLKKLFARVILAAPVDRATRTDAGWPLGEGLVDFVELPTVPFPMNLGCLRRPVAHLKPLSRAIRQADVVHTILPGYVQLMGLGLARCHGKPVFSALVGDWSGLFRSSRWKQTHPVLIQPLANLHEAATRWVVRHSGLVLAHGTALLDRYAGGRTPVVSDCMSTFSQADIGRPEDLPADDGPPPILFVGRVDVKKGLLVLCRAMAILREQGLRPPVTIVGEGPDRPQVEAVIAELGLGEQVRLRGYVAVGPELWGLYRRHRIFTLPSFSEGAPKVIIEAYAAGLPVVATNVGGIPAMVGPDQGILVPARDEAALARAFADLIRNPQRRRQLALNNLAVAAEFTMDAEVARIGAHLARHMPFLLTGRTRTPA
ncbi:MAG: glycosyltransferase [Planctomycetota bacterium]|nr:glycosyltransferase [Planctomycetota bacterium]